MPTDEQELEFEVLPPENENGNGQDPDAQKLIAQLIARVMDNLFVIPGTNFRIGLDPILGLIPGVGDGGTALVSTLVLLQAATQGTPRIVLARMALNILINTAGGAIPVAGDVFSAWYKSNARNYELLQKFAQTAKPTSTRKDWLFVGGLLGGLVAAIIGILVCIFWVLGQLIGLLG